MFITSNCKNNRKIVEILQKRTIDAVFISHAHTDHIGGCCSLKKVFVLEKLAKPNPSKNKDLNVPFYMSTGTVLESKKFTCQIITRLSMMEV